MKASARNAKPSGRKCSGPNWTLTEDRTRRTTLVIKLAVFILLPSFVVQNVPAFYEQPLSVQPGRGRA